LQDVTESKDIIQKELDETNCWYNNQQQLMEEMKKLNQHVSDLEEQRDLLSRSTRVQQELHKRLMAHHGIGKCEMIPKPEVDTQPQRMQTTNASVKKFFKKEETPR
jgi:hypothetical protein